MSKIIIRRKCVPRAVDPPKQQLESPIVYECLKWLLDHGYFVWRNSVGCCKVGRRWLRFGLKGSSDILGVTPKGKLIACEVKTLTGRLRPEQKAFLDRVKVNSGLAIVARSVDDLEAQIRTYENQNSN